MEINHNQLKEIIKKGYYNNVSLDIKGHPGIGKSQVVEQAAKELAKEHKLTFVDWQKDNTDKIESMDPKKIFIFADMRLHQMDPTGLLGIPDISKDVVEWKPIKLFKFLSEKGIKGILFFDEANLAQDSVLASAYSIINDSKIGDLHISEEVMKITAGNLLEDGCNVTIETPALNNRRMNFVLSSPNYENWSKWASKNSVDDRIISYLNWSPKSMFNFDEKVSDASFPSPRSWENLSKMIKKESDIAFIKILASGLVGDVEASSFCGYLNMTKKIPFKEILNNPELIHKYNKEKDFVGIQYNILSSCISEYKQSKSKKKYLDKCMMLGAELSDELLVYFVRSLKFKYGNEIIDYLKISKHKNVLSRIGKNIV